MKKEILFAIIGFVVGALVITMTVAIAMPKMMLIETVSQYDFDTTFEMINQSVEKHEWKIPVVHDLQKTMAKYGKTVRPVKVIELCHPDHAGRILAENEERIVSSLMPCRVAIYEKEDGKTYISRMNSGMMSSMMGGLIKEVMTIAADENELILEPVLTK